MKKFAAFIMAILMVSQTAYAETAKTDSYNISFEIDAFIYNNERTAEYSTFIYENTKYVPLRAVSNFLGKEVSYNSADGSINIIDSSKDVAYQSFVIEEKEVTAKVVYNSIKYNNVDIKEVENDFKNERKRKEIYNENVVLLNYNGNIYIPLKWLTEDFGLLREYNKSIITITKPSTKLKYIQNSKLDFRDYCEDFDNKDNIISDDLINEALLRQWDHFSEPFVVGVTYKTLYYEGNLAIGVYTDVLNAESRLLTEVYEVVKE